ncbi:MAG: dTDP-4-dehydrorhamnose reductase [Planctomycetota bacterium]|nr:dTDP-4-dehydrorhamnose reductase [Planctomycetota bacterium]MDA1113675.1 dTDP-4-dehydrorhamnose reductase [Planctomycetota bacterium]
MSPTQRILLTGRNGQLGTECGLVIPADCEVIAVDFPEFDLADADVLARTVREVQPDMLLHAAAWTAVDKAEEWEAEAHVINATATDILASCMAEIGGRMAYLSTDYVFSGEGSVPWREHDPVAPLNAYGRTKLAGEQAVAAHLGDRGHVVRTSWLYGRCGANFVRTMLHLMSSGRALKVVEDQVGSPTWAGGLAKALFALARASEAPPILHFTDEGIVSWFDFAIAIRACGLANGLALEESSVTACPGSEYPTPAARPSWSPLYFSDAWHDLGIAPSNWEQALQTALPLLLKEDAKAT